MGVAVVAQQLLHAVALSAAPPTSGALVRPLVQVHQLMARQVTGVVEAFAADVADEGLVEVGHPVRLQHADAGVALPADVAVARLLAGVPRLHVQVAVRFVVEPLGAVTAGVRQQPVLFDLMLAEPQDSGEEHSAHRAPDDTASRDHPAAQSLETTCRTVNTAGEAPPPEELC